MRKSHWALAVMILGVVPRAWGQEAQGSFFHRPPPAPAGPSPLASPAPPAVEASPIPAPQPASPSPVPPDTARPAPAAPIQTETGPVLDHCGSNIDAVLQFVRFFFANQSASTRVVLGYQELIYADQVNYYGKAMPRAVVLRQKEAYLNRWPVRTYTLRGDGDIKCDGTTGIYGFSGLVDWTARNPAIRDRPVKSGVATVWLGISPSSISSFKIVRESSEVTERHPDQQPYPQR